MDIDSSDVYEKLITRVLRFVSYRPRSQKEVNDFLVKTLRRHSTTAPKVIDRVLARLDELGYVNDEAFTQWFVQGRSGHKPRGDRNIALELRQKGVKKEIIEKVMQKELVGEKSERDRAVLLIHKKRTYWSHLPKMEQKQKLAAYLLRRGFDNETVWSLVDDSLDSV